MAKQSIRILTAVSGVGPATIENFRAAGYETLEDLQGIGPAALEAVPGVGAATAEAILAFLEKAPADPVQAYRHAQKRAHIPEAGIAAHGKVEERPATRYFYDPHLDPVLRFDATGEDDGLPALVAEARRRALTAEEAQLLAAALRNREPWLEWAGKREQGWFDVDPVALHIHERVSTEAIIAAARRRPIQPSLFADPEMEWREAVRFYEHEMDWANRLILGDSLQVMHSLAVRENLAGKVQMIYIDPPYGINYRSNFQPFIGVREVKDRDVDLTREPEQIRAYRDTWQLGVHSYLSYLRERLRVSRELLADSGAIFVQISDENLHRARNLLDETFGAENFIALITFVSSVPLGATFLPGVCTYILFYAKNKETLKFRRLFKEKPTGEGGAYTSVMLPSGEHRTMTKLERENTTLLPEGAQPFFNLSMLSAGLTPSCVFPVHTFGKTYHPGSSRSWKTNQKGMARLIKSGRIIGTPSTIRYILLHSDYAVAELTDIWSDIGSVLDKAFVVQTPVRVIERCMLMTTDPGDLVLDPTCGAPRGAV